MSDRVSEHRSTTPVRRQRSAATFDRRAFLARLTRMSVEERVRASRYEFTTRERTIWAGRFPEEVPLINGELEWIAARSPELDVGSD
jgi:hypothetical protein